MDIKSCKNIVEQITALQNLYKDIDNLPQAEKEIIKNNIKKAIIIKRMSAQTSINYFNYYFDELKRVERLHNKGKANGVNNTLLEPIISELLKNVNLYRDYMVSHGKMFCSLLGLWELFGATIFDLLDLCCTEPSLRQRILRDPENTSMSLSKIAFICCPDYNHYGGDFYETTNYAPMTHCIKEFYLKLMKSMTTIDPALDQKVNDKMFELFPSLQDNIITEASDEEGNRFWVDKNNVPIGFISKAQPLSDNMRLILTTAIQKVITDGDESDKKLTTFVTAIMVKALGDKNSEITEYLRACSESLQFSPKMI